ncbi:MAG: hypothetical protein IJ545_03155 [Alphaproteobacteria bacterium]|nr:hypothetical protein [Alphaproteobacteria bacterium]
MKLFNSVLFCVLLLSSVAVRAEEEKSQEYYDKQVEENMKQITSQLKQMSSEMTKYMNAMNKYMNESMPELSENMSKFMSSVKPLTETMQKNMQAFADQVNAEIEAAEKNKDNSEKLVPAPVKTELASSEIIAPEDVQIAEPQAQELDSAIDAELAQFHQEQPSKIKLFPSSVE